MPSQGRNRAREAASGLPGSARRWNRVRNFRSPSGVRPPFPKIPKVREHVRMTLTNGEELLGCVFIEATTRIQDLLNNDAHFIPFIDDREALRLINKASILQVLPIDG
jgi:hypothetical protein